MRGIHPEAAEELLRRYTFTVPMRRIASLSRRAAGSSGAAGALCAGAREATHIPARSRQAGEVSCGQYHRDRFVTPTLGLRY